MRLTALGLRPVVATTGRLGLYFADSGPPTIYSVADNAPAAVGLAPGDVVQAVNGYAYTEAGLRWAASYTEPVTLSVLRGHRRLSFTMTPAPAAETVALQWEGSPAQAVRIANWLGADFNPRRRDEFSVEFYENSHGVEFQI